MDAVEERLVGVLSRARALGFLGPGDLEEHIEHATGWLAVIPSGTKVLDLGSGGGLPGLVVAAHRPDVVLTLLDSQRKRCSFLREALEDLGRPDVDVACGRAEVLARDPGLRGSFDIVCARSFGQPAVTAECGVGFLSPGGCLWVSEPPGLRAEERWPTEGLALLGLRRGEFIGGPSVNLQQLVLDGACDDRHPRGDGRPAKRPLF